MKVFNLPIIVFCIFCAAALSGCSEAELASYFAKSATQDSQQGTFKVGKPYQVEGRWYQPKETYNYSETGIASWYGPGFHGKRTASGERFDQNELTAAHRTLQMPSLVRVTNLENGRSLVVRVNDRGPFKRGRVIDVTKRAADLLGFRGKGTARVRLDLLPNESQQIANAAKQGIDTSGYEVAVNNRQPIPGAPVTHTDQTQPLYQQAAYQPPAAAQPAPPPRAVEYAENVPGHVSNGTFFPDPVVTQQPVRPTSLFVQAGAFSDLANAQKLAYNMQAVGQAQVFPTMAHGQTLYRVRVGPFANVEAADRLLTQAVNAGFSESIIVVD